MSMATAASGWADPMNMPPRMRRAFLHQLCHESFPVFFLAAYKMLNPGKPVPQDPYIYAMLHQLEQLVTGDLRRLVLNLPPRHGKTEFGTCMLAAWILGRDPAAKVFVVSYGLALSEKITGRIRRIVTHPDYQRIFPDTRLKPGENRAGHFVTTASGECMAASPDSAITGFGTQYMLVDDFQKADEALSPIQRENAISTFRNTLLSRFDNLGLGRILINQQRLNEDDISGWGISIGWPQFRLPAIAEEDATYVLPRGGIWQRKKGDVLSPTQAPLAFLNEQRLAQGTRFFSAQYQQDPGVSEGSLVDMLWFGRYDEMPPRRVFLKIVQSWDPAITERLTSDYSVGMTCGYDGKYWYLLDVIRVQIGFGALLARIIAWHRQWQADALIIEGASIGHSLYDQVREKRVPGLILNPTPRGSKPDRLAACTAQLATGDYLLPRTAPWLWDFERELLAFPDGRNDDQVDALTQFLDFAFDRRRWLKKQYCANGRPKSIVREPRRPLSY